MSGSHGSDSNAAKQKSPMRWVTGTFMGIAILAGFLLLLKGCASDDRPSTDQSRTGNHTPVIGGPVVGSNMHPAVTDSIINYQVQLEIPKGDTIPIPSKDDGWSDPVRGRGGFQLMREADRGRDSYNTEHQLPGSDDWVTGVSYDEIAERYQSKGEAQKLTYSYLPYDPANPRR